MNRIPLWVDVRAVSDAALGACIEAAQSVGCEGIIGGPLRVDGVAVVDADDVLQATIVGLANAADQARAAAFDGRIIIDAADWTIIPLENLIAARRDRPDSLYAFAPDAETCGVFRDTLDIGVHGVVLQTTNAAEIRLAHEVLVAKGPRPDDRPGADGGHPLTTARVIEVRDAGPGDRVCIDTTSALADGEGLLVGSRASGFALLHAETEESEYVRARPFRINAGALHNYVLAPGGKTRYLSELAAGAEVLAVACDGAERTLHVGRAKIERRPHLLVRWQGAAGVGHVIVQNAETIRFVGPAGAQSVTALVAGDEILVHEATGARHFGMPIDERLVER